MKTVNKRIEALESGPGNGGQSWFVRLEDGVYRVDDNSETLELNEKQFEEWRNSKNKNDDFVFFIIERGKK